MFHFNSGNAVCYALSVYLFEKIMFSPECPELALPAAMPRSCLALHVPWYMAASPNRDTTPI